MSPFRVLKASLDILSCALDIFSRTIKSIAAASQGKSGNQGKNTKDHHSLHSRFFLSLGYECKTHTIISITQEGLARLSAVFIIFILRCTRHFALPFRSLAPK